MCDIKRSKLFDQEFLALMSLFITTNKYSDTFKESIIIGGNSRALFAITHIVNIFMGCL